MKSLLFILLLASGQAFARDSLIIDAYTHHTTKCGNVGEDLCEPWKQPHRLSWEHSLTDDLSTDIGFGLNSYHKHSFNAGLSYQPIKAGAFSFGAWGSLVSGYTCVQLKTCFVAAGIVATAHYGKTQIQFVTPFTNKSPVYQVRVGISW